MKRYRLWTKLPGMLHPQLFFLSVIPATVGAALAFSNTGRWDNEIFFISIAGILLLQAAISIINDYALFCRAQKAGYTGRLEGAAEAMRRGILREEQVVGASIMLTVMGGLCAVLLSMLAGSSILLIAAAAVICGYALNFPRGGTFRFGAGELLAAGCCSLFPLLAVYNLQTLSIALPPFAAALPLGMLSAALIIIEQMRRPRELPAQGALVRKLGTQNTARVVSALLLLWPVFVTGMLLAGTLPPQTGLCALAVVPAGAAAIVCLRKHSSPLGLETGLALAFIAHVLAGMAIAAGLLMVGRGLEPVW